MRILRAADYKRMPWKNGGGETVEVAVFPDQAGVDDFDWRVSMAGVVQDGAFSRFPDVDRTLSVLSGEAIRLSIAGHEPVLLDPSALPYRFPADLETSATLPAGPITDLNVMTRRGRFDHRVERVDVPGDVRPDADLVLLLCWQGPVELDTSAGPATLGPLDAVLIDKPASAIALLGAGTVFVISLKTL